MKIVFMGTPEFSVEVLETLNKNFEVSLVVTQEDKEKGRGKKLLPSPVKLKAKELNIEVYQPKNINSLESFQKLKSVDADFFVVLAYGQILKKEILDLPKIISVNIHPSILPHLRGAAPVNRAIINGDKKTGVSIMKMGVGLDDGDVSLVRELEINDMNIFELNKKLSTISSELIVEFLNNYNNIIFEKQKGNITYADKISKETGYIDFNNYTSEQIYNLVRGLDDNQSAYTFYNDIKFKVLEVKIINTNFEGIPGEILDSNKKLLVKTKNGAIEILKLQFPGKKVLTIKEYLAGNKFELKNILGNKIN